MRYHHTRVGGAIIDKVPDLRDKGNRMGVSKNQGPKKPTPNTTAPIRRTPQKGPPTHGNKQPSQGLA